MTQRIIKFRAWDGTKMHDGDRIILRSHPEVASGVSSFTLNSFFKEFEAKGWTFQQFTGEVDKEGRDVYEGDILKLEFGKPQLEPRIGRVEFGYTEDSDGWAQELTHGWIVETETNNDPNGWPRTYFSLVDEVARCTIIGNIYEHPTLISHPLT